MCSSKQGKGLPVTCHAAQRWSRGVAPLSPNVGARWRQKSRGSHLRMLGGPQVRIRSVFEEEKFLAPTGVRTTD